jgi:hypothetical protein
LKFRLAPITQTVKHHLMDIPAKFGSNGPNGFREEN